MERTINKTSAPVPVDDRIRWKKEGGGSARLRINGVPRIIKPGEVFTASPNDIPDSFRNVIFPLEAIKKVEESKVEGAIVSFTVKPRGKSKSMFDVVDGNGKRMNDTPLSKDTANKFKESLEK